MRSIIYKALTEDPFLSGRIPEGKWFENGSIIDVPGGLFAVLSWGPVSGPAVAMQARTFQLYVHDRRGSYDLIDLVIQRAEEILHQLFDTWQGDSHVSSTTWIGASGDLEDPEYKTNMRYVEFRIAGR